MPCHAIHYPKAILPLWRRQTGLSSNCDGLADVDRLVTPASWEEDNLTFSLDTLQGAIT